MCLAQPAKIIRIKGKRAIVSQGGHRCQVDISFISQPLKKGDFILASQGIAINKVAKNEAKKIISLTNELPHT